ncbi:helix-turn-helix domain-containing protein [Ruminiclostridium papyrosolvens]|uniref:XRE family transcriptional regulator n=1 Tax=Ruminiclostridium papyrosolvens C7 TaxID=1330534 RepID=U4QWM9_9FIRM|nr:helix-turn-helix transcriptional regulator [Ruminiclostridium papyrosolvens]EPR07673.1 XRE family transcriptional regulator [Ruminiclostridium papyrosolvens C7]
MEEKLLRKLRKSKKLTQADVASALEIGRSTYTKYESGKSKPVSEMLIKIADYFGVSVDYLLGRTDIRNYQESKIKTKAYHNLDVTGLPDEAVKQVEDYIELIKLKYKPDGSYKKGL